MIETTPRISRPPFACPSCGAPLEVEAVAKCPVEALSFERNAGVWNLIAPEREAYFERFIEEYDRIRAMEGRGGASPEYFRRLPFEDRSGRFDADWRVRAASFACFVDDVLEDLERSRPSSGALRILDLGAGNCWMSNRLSARGHAVVAVDLRTGPEDGLAAHSHYENRFEVVRAEFDRLPFEDASINLAVFNASFHYSENYERTLREAMRVLKPGGRIVILDTPLYHVASSGDAMIRERSARFVKQYGTASDSLSSEGYLTEKRLRQIAARCGVTWSLHRPTYGLGWMIRRGVSRLRNRREPARFAVIEGVPSVAAESAIEHMTPTRLLRGIGRTGLRIRYLARQKRLLRQTSETTIEGLRLNIPAGVFHPNVFRSGIVLAQLLLDGVLPPGARVLDLGCGSGICALAAAKRGADVTASDINPDAVAATLHNAALNGLEMSALKSDLFEHVGRFDVVLFNPPYYAGAPETRFDLAWRSDDLVERFSRQLSRHLRPAGFALVVLSSDGRSGDYLRRFEADGHRITRVAERRFLNETFTIFRLR